MSNKTTTFMYQFFVKNKTGILHTNAEKQNKNSVFF